MNSGESTAGCSSSGQENGAASLDPERPHKKARFPWQIKGKHYLKNEPMVCSNVIPQESETFKAPPTAERILRTNTYPRKTFEEIFVPSKSMPANVNNLTGGPANIHNTADPPLPLETGRSLSGIMILNSGIEVTKKRSTSTQDLPGPSKRFSNSKQKTKLKKHHLKNQTNKPMISLNIIPQESETFKASPKAERILRTNPYPRRTFEEIFVPRKSMPANVNNLTGGPAKIHNTADPPLPLETVRSLAGAMLLNSGIEVTKKGSTSTQDLPGPSKPFSDSAREAYQLKRKEDECIAQWQALQADRSGLDNRINHILDSWVISHPEADNIFVATDVNGIINDDLSSNDENVENEGILMAINAHGLQSMSHPTIEPTSPLPAHPPVLQYPCNYQSESSSSSEDSEILTKRDSLPWLFDERTNNEPANYEPWRHGILNTNSTEQYPTAGEDYEYEFMNTAVIQAIKSKGLMAAGTDFG